MADDPALTRETAARVPVPAVLQRSNSGGSPHFTFGCL
jgi:hypothetical protein